MQAPLAEDKFTAVPRQEYAVNDADSCRWSIYVVRVELPRDN